MPRASTVTGLRSAPEQQTGSLFSTAYALFPPLQLTLSLLMHAELFFKIVWLIADTLSCYLLTAHSGRRNGH